MKDSSSHIGPARAAAAILEEYYLERLTDEQLKDICWDKGIVIKEEFIEGSTGRICYNDSGGAIVTLSSAIREQGRKNFALGHELGHFMMHKHLQPIFVCTDEMFLPWYKGSSIEPEANAFAANLLLPAQSFKKRVRTSKPTKSLFVDCAQEFFASITSTLVRYVEIGPEPCLLAVSTAGKLSWYMKSEDFAPRLSVYPGMMLSDLSCAGDYFENGTVEQEAQLVDRTAWIVTQESEQTFVNELCIYMSSYNTVVSLVWF